MTEILRFEMNVPTEVALKDAGPGKPIEGRYGNRVMYTLADNRVMYVAPIVASRISDLGIQPGELFHVRKQLKRQGQKTLIEWDVQRLASELETQLERELRESIEVAQGAKAAAESSEEHNPEAPPQEQTTTPPNSAPTPAIAPVSNGFGDSNETPAARNRINPLPVTTNLEDTLKATTSMAHDSGTNLRCAQERTARIVPAATPAVVPSANGSPNGSAASTQGNGNSAAPVTTKLEHALKTAISAAYNAEKYGAELGYVVRFDADAIKSMAITVLINMNEGSRR